MRLKIVSVGEPVLRQAARELTMDEILSDEVQRLIGYMRETMRDAPGVGLAAPQIGEPLRITVIEDKVEYHKGLTEAELAERGRIAVPFHVFINPEIELLGEASEVFAEGCLSLPGYLAQVPRAKAVRVRYLDEHAEAKTVEASGWSARILQHEIDHLNGTLYIDRMNSQTFSTLDNYTRHGKTQPPQT